MATFWNNFQHLEIRLEEIISATNNFDDSNVIGFGGFGKVYKGELTLPEGKSMVAFKRLDRKYGQGDPEFFKEIRMLSCYKHKNLISLLGYCKEGGEMILMYEYASRGSLERILNDAALTWTQRLKICLDAAKGLSFLHDPKGTQQRVLHRDIKSANILLDENLNAKVADFGLSKIGPANQQHTFLVTSPAGTHGYCDPLYMDSYQLTKESDVYSFGVVLFEVLCGRVCYENSDHKLKIFVPYWKKCYELKKLDEIIFPDLKQKMDPRSVETFVDIAYQCLQKSREQRPTMSVVVEKLEIALLLELHDLQLLRNYEYEEMCKAAEYEYGELLKIADPPLIYKSIEELKALVTKGFPVNQGKTIVAVNDKGQVCERIYIEGCLIPSEIQSYKLEHPTEDYINSRFPSGRRYTFRKELTVRVRAQFLCPLITYGVNLFFRDTGSVTEAMTLEYKLDGEKFFCKIYDTYKREDGWFVAPLYQFKSDSKTKYIQIYFEYLSDEYTFQVAGFEFQPLEEKVELHGELEKYQDIVKAASQSLFYKSLEELEMLLSIGVHLNNHKTWFSINKNGEHSEMLSVADCLIPREGYSLSYTRPSSRFPSGTYRTNRKGFKVHIRTQFLTPSIRYTVNLVFFKGEYSDYYNKKILYVALKYKLKGGRETSIQYLATRTKDNLSFITELYQFTSNGRTFDLEIVFEDHIHDIEVEGILFQPLEKVEHEQVLEDDTLSNDSLQWILKKGLFSNLLKRSKGQKGYAVDNNGKKSLMFTARGVIKCPCISPFQSLPESRFQEVIVIDSGAFNIEKKIKPGVLSPETTYALYLVYKSTEDQHVLERTYRDHKYIYLVYIYLVSPHTPIIGQKLDHKTHNPLKRSEFIVILQQRSDGWMEVKVHEYQTPRSQETLNIDICLSHPERKMIRGLIIESIELRPIVSF